MNDQLETIGNTRIQHGKDNDRVYVMSLGMDELDTITKDLEKIVEEHNYSKVIAKVPKDAKSKFRHAGFKLEATIPNFYNGEIDGLFMAKYYNENRKKQKEKKRANKVIQTAINKPLLDKNIELDDHFKSRILKPEDASEMAELYKEVFKTYPFPIFDEDYLIKTMNSHVVYFGIWHDEKLVGLSSCEMNKEASNVEMTDFAILKEYRGNNLAFFLLNVMEEHMKSIGIKTAYSMARSQSFGMNITFSKVGYQYGGTLINNTHIGGSIESLNIWFKPLI
ncbi:putative beta-lysine N-acetyltransferase [Haloplasma contractile]|uniref:Phospholipiddiacylglycerol acyltransferase protein n=1 Tax=Haloplasma contractile SSD-17B TaxID=1033810 RepID=U2EAE1_9MOLU|nr:putative beta-lysine N-acetyltransferase [Haloplasma contractile]ERJ12063.1 phospholipiddiacylglycerol acyltransferase protein [Haloplasma contractile SSD-17B]